MAFIIYNHYDVGAPVLNGLTGSLCTVLSSSLLSGYGSKTGAGWECSFSSSNVNPTTMIFKQPSGSQMYLRVQDNGPGSHGGREARLTGYETASNLNSGSGQFPLLAQLSIGSGSVVVRKSSTANNSQIGWHIIVDSSTLYMLMYTNDVLHYYGWMFGDIYSTKINDPYKACLIGRNLEASTTITNDGMLTLSPSNLTACLGHYMPRSYTELGSSIQMGKHGNIYMAVSLFYGVIPFPNPQDGSFWLSPFYISEGTNSIRGRLRGLWQWLHPFTTNLGNDTDLSGSGDLTGKTFKIFNSGSQRWYMFETSDTVNTN